MIWWISSGLIVVWFVLRFVLNQKGWVHLLLLSGATALIIQIAAYRKTQYQSRSKSE